MAFWAVGAEWLVRRMDRRGTAWTLALAGSVTAFIVSGPYVFAKPGPRPWSAVSEWLAERPADERIVAMGLTRAPLVHQLRRRGSERPVESFPPDIADHIGRWHPRDYDTEKLIDDAIAIAATGAPSVWMILPLNEAQPAWPRGTNIVMEAFRRAGWGREPPQSLGEFGVVRFTRPR